MYQKFLTFIEKKKLLKPGDKVLVGVSGGVDSVVLLHLLHEAGVSLAVGHVNYHLRGEDSEKDARLVEQICEKLQVKLHTKEVDPKVYQSGDSIQMIARKIRYDFFKEISNQFHYTKIATAHNANDNLETVIFNLTKGTGISGLAGIAAQSGEVVRPLLFATKEAIYKYAESTELKWREDVTNTKNDYHRNLIRNEVIPLLKRINPSVEETFGDTLTRLNGTHELINSKVSKILDEAQDVQGGCRISLDWVDDTDGAVALLYEVMKTFGMNFRQVIDMRESILRKHSGAVFQTRDYLISLDRKQVYVSEVNVAEPVKVNIKIAEGESEAIAAHLKVSLEKSSSDQPFEPDDNIAYLDYGKLTFPLTIRNWTEGDSFRPLGMKGKKKVSDFMIDSKIPVTLKRKALVLESEGNIAWLMGYRIDDRYKITEATTEVLKVTIGHV